MLDVVEHLHPHELDTVLGEVIRILRTGGRLIVHTMPNLWYYRYGYPLYRMMQYLRGQSLPVDPRDRWPYAHVHVNEQDPKRLGRTLTLAGFRSRVWLRTTQSYAYEKNRFVRMGMEILTRWVPFRWLFCNDIFAIGTKPGGL
jgi:predicted SAM-dependent methyltransferase